MEKRMIMIYLCNYSLKQSLIKITFVPYLSPSYPSFLFPFPFPFPFPFFCLSLCLVNTQTPNELPCSTEFDHLRIVLKESIQLGPRP